MARLCRPASIAPPDHVWPPGLRLPPPPHRSFLTVRWTSTANGQMDREPSLSRQKRPNKCLSIPLARERLTTGQEVEESDPVDQL